MAITQIPTKGRLGKGLLQSVKGLLWKGFKPSVVFHRAVITMETAPYAGITLTTSPYAGITLTTSPYAEITIGV